MVPTAEPCSERGLLDVLAPLGSRGRLFGWTQLWCSSRATEAGVASVSPRVTGFGPLRRLAAADDRELGELAQSLGYLGPSRTAAALVVAERGEAVGGSSGVVGGEFPCPLQGGALA